MLMLCILKIRRSDLFLLNLFISISELRNDKFSNIFEENIKEIVMIAS
jgi:hypothetical protein